MKAVVLIVNWNSWRDTLECLASVFRSDLPELRVVVCDNDSSDDSVERIREWAARQPGTGDERGGEPRDPLRFEEYRRPEVERGEPEHRPGRSLVLIHTGGNLGFAGGNNVGLQYALGDPGVGWVWLLNPDTVVHPSALRAMVEHGESDPEIGMVGSRILFYDDPGVIQAIAGGHFIPWQGMTRFLGRGERDDGQWNTPLQPDYITGCSLLVRADTVRSIGWMDERYFLYSEEVDWCLRARRANWKLVYCPGSVVWHKEGKTVGRKNPRSDYYSVRSLLLLTQKFHPRLLPVVLAHSVVRCLLTKVVRLHFDRFRAVVHAYRDFFALRASSRGPAGALRTGELPTMRRSLH